VRVPLILIFILSVLIVANAQTQKASKQIKRILFVGNSLTYTNGLPDLVAKIGKEKGIAIKPEMLAFPNYGLEDHWKDGRLQKLIANNKFDFVVVQQGPSSQEEGKRMLFDYGEKIKTLCDDQHTKLAFFMVWPAKVNYQNFDGVIKNYSEAATNTKSILCPVGQVWKEHFDTTNDFSYYDDDGFHPSKTGSQLAAEVIFRSLFQ
jgi:hypothetical protein